MTSLPHAYFPGNNPAGDGASYRCDSCGLELYDEQVGYVAAGTQYANGEHSRCPRCGEENFFDRKCDSEC